MTKVNVSWSSEPNDTEIRPPKLDTLKDMAVDGSYKYTAMPETRREEFTRYMEKTNVLGSMTKALYVLYKEPMKPVNPTRFFVQRLISGQGIQMELDYLTGELDNMTRNFLHMKRENNELRRNLADLGITSVSDEDGRTIIDE